MSLSYIFSIFQSSREEALPPPPEQSNAVKIGHMIKDDITAYIIDPNKKVMDEPNRALIYTTIIKIVSLFVALVFPFIGYTTLGISIALIDRIIVLNFLDFTNKIISSISVDLFQNILRTIFGIKRNPPPTDNTKS